jgi:hypothetical protein
VPFDQLLVAGTSPLSPLVIVAGIFLEEGASLERLRQCAKTMCNVYERLRCRVVDNECVPPPQCCSSVCSSVCARPSLLLYSC